MGSNKNMELLKSYEDYRLKCKSLGIEPLDVSISLKNSIVTLTKSDNKNIKSVLIPKFINNIEDNAFKRCEKLEKVVMGNNIKEIGDCAFDGCKILEECVLSESLEEVGTRLFAMCKKLNTIKLPNIEYISEKMFSESGLRSIEIPGSVESILTQAFEYCNKLVNVKFNEGLDTIFVGAFRSTSIEKLILPNSLRNIHPMAFAECKKLKYIEFPDTLEYIDDEAFWDVDMTKVEIKCSDKTMKLLKESKVV